MHSPLVSVIIPCYNAGRWVGDAIRSALNQTYTNVEIIVIDDGSTDDSLEVIRAFKDKVRWKTGVNHGPCAARNLGLGLAQGEWVQFLDADDLLHPQKIQLALESYKHHSNADFVWAPNTPVAESFSLSCCSSTEYDLFDLEVTVSQNVLDAAYAPSAAMFRAGFLTRVGQWNQSVKRWVDLEYHARIAATNPSYIRISKPFYFYRQHEGDRISNSNRNHSNIHSAIHSLALTKATLETSTILPAMWKSFLWSFYLQLALSAAVTGDNKLFLGLMQQAVDLRGNLKFQLKCELAKVSTQILGLKVTTALIERALRSRSSKS